MEKYTLENDIKIYCREVKTFPQGIPAAFDELSKKLPAAGDKTFYGISYNNKAGDIVYKVAVATSVKWDGEKSGYEPYTIPKGEYITEKIADWKTSIPLIGSTFMKLNEQPGVLPHALCVEWYKTNTELLCMVRVG
jgi:predicted transcriptional regulator YdeE